MHKGLLIFENPFYTSCLFGNRHVDFLADFSSELLLLLRLSVYPIGSKLEESHVKTLLVFEWQGGCAEKRFFVIPLFC
jgi:hypothetical protein